MSPADTPSLLTDAQLRPYLDDVRLWHGYVRFLGLPTMIDNPDTPMNVLFVTPLLHEQAVTPESDPAGWPKGQSLLAALERHKRLVILGDPGCGKSTLINWLAWMKSRRCCANPCATRCGRVLSVIPRQYSSSRHGWWAMTKCP